MKNVLLIGASGGIGSALATAMVAGGFHVTALSRSTHDLDITDEASVARHLDPLDGPFDLVFVATGALEINGAAPEKTLRQISAQSLADQFALNAIGPALVLKHAARLMPRKTPAVFAALSARVGSIGDNRLGGWYSYRASKSALNQLVHGAAIELARTHKGLACVALHPGTVATSFTQKYQGRHPAVPPADAAANLLRVVRGLTPADTGKFFDWRGDEVPW